MGTLPLPLEFHNGEPPLTIEIPLTRGYITVVDAVDGDLTAFRWFPAIKNGRVYVWRKTLGCANADKKTIHLHRVIYERIIGRILLSTELVDHEDNNPLNNQRGNLRLADKAKNAMNSKRRYNNLSGYKGVQWHGKSGKWVAEIKVDGKKMRLGTFADPKEAYDAYCEAARKYFGEFARLE